MRRVVVMWKQAYDRALLPESSDRYARQITFDQSKPEGVWYSPGDEWLAWVAENMPKWLTAHRYEITFDDSRLLALRTLRELLQFQVDYGSGETVIGRAIGHDDPYARFLEGIDWARVRGDYDGIEIAPYQWEARLDLMWYYTWDVASGCLWNRAAIQSVEPYVWHPEAVEALETADEDAEVDDGR